MVLRQMIINAQAGDAGAFDALVRRFSAVTLCYAPADRVPREVERIFPFVKDPHPRVRAVALQALRAYLGLNDPRIESAIRQAFDALDHGTQHLAAADLRIKCPGCGQVPKDCGRVGSGK